MKTDEEELSNKQTNRLLYLEAAMLMNRVLDARNFKAVTDALAKKDETQGFKDFNAICVELKISEGAANSLWNTMKDTRNRLALEPGWIPGM